MGCKVIFSPQALVDLEAAVCFIAQDNPAAAVRFGNALIDRVAILEIFHCLGLPIPNVPACANWFSVPTSFFTAFARRRLTWTSCVTGIVRNASRICLRWIENRGNHPLITVAPAAGRELKIV